MLTEAHPGVVRLGAALHLVDPDARPEPGADADVAALSPRDRVRHARDHVRRTRVLLASTGAVATVALTAIAVVLIGDPLTVACAALLGGAVVAGVWRMWTVRERDLGSGRHLIHTEFADSFEPVDDRTDWRALWELMRRNRDLDDVATAVQDGEPGDPGRDELLRRWRRELDELELLARRQRLAMVDLELVRQLIDEETARTVELDDEDGALD